MAMFTRLARLITIRCKDRIVGPKTGGPAERSGRACLLRRFACRQQENSRKAIDPASGFQNRRVDWSSLTSKPATVASSGGPASSLLCAASRSLPWRASPFSSFSLRPSFSWWSSSSLPFSSRLSSSWPPSSSRSSFS